MGERGRGAQTVRVALASGARPRRGGRPHLERVSQLERVPRRSRRAAARSGRRLGAVDARAACRRGRRGAPHRVGQRREPRARPSAGPVARIRRAFGARRQSWACAATGADRKPRAGVNRWNRRRRARSGVDARAHHRLPGCASTRRRSRHQHPGHTRRRRRDNRRGRVVGDSRRASRGTPRPRGRPPRWRTLRRRPQGATRGTRARRHAGGRVVGTALLRRAADANLLETDEGEAGVRAPARARLSPLSAERSLQGRDVDRPVLRGRDGCAADDPRCTGRLQHDGIAVRERRFVRLVHPGGARRPAGEQSVGHRLREHAGLRAGTRHFAGARTLVHWRKTTRRASTW